MTSLLIENGRFIDPSQSIDRVATLLLENGIVSAIDPDADSVRNHDDLRWIDATDKIVCPGLVDLCAEFRQPGRDEDESIASGAAAALAGGFTTVLCGANTYPPIDSPGAVEFVRQKATAANGPRIHVVACVSKERRGEQMAELGLLVDAGAIAFSDSPSPIANSALLK
ncbi:MAG: dihydroorotase, partial [Planctomycetota bacterium]